MKGINIISFDVPYPPNYGGIIDVFYKIKFFYAQGIKIHLHCFEYGRGIRKELNQYCASLNYYKRSTGITSQLSCVPYIVKSRESDQLKQNLLRNNFPILFEGLHSCFLLGNKLFDNRLKIFRESNIEHQYYYHLSKAERNIIKKQYYRYESIKLKRFEPIIQHADIFLVVSSKDLIYFQNRYPNNQAKLVSSFHPYTEVNIKPGKGNYVLYHGNLSVPENHNAVRFIIDNIFHNLSVPLKIAGLNPPSSLTALINKYPHIELIENPNNKQLTKLVQNAQMNLLYTAQSTGLKLKLLNALYNGRHCIVNSKMVEGTFLDKVCVVEDDPNNLKEIIQKYFSLELLDKDVVSRNKILHKYYSNENNFKIINEIFIRKNF